MAVVGCVLRVPLCKILVQHTKLWQCQKLLCKAELWVQWDGSR